MQLNRRITRLSVAGIALLLAATACTKGSSHRPPAQTTTATRTSTAVGSASPSSSPSLPPAHIDFSDCSTQFQAAIGTAKAKTMTFSCGKLTVPLDYSKPTATDIQLFVVRIHSKSQKPANRIGSLLVNPGGPGGSGVNLAAGLVGALSDDIFARFDLVGFDPRGVGLSGPLQCIGDKQKDQLAAADPDPRTVAGRALARTESAAVVQACVAKYGPALAHYNTEETAHDMDLIRQAVGDPKLNYLGFSYGTRLGAAYAHEFPTRIRAAVLDGAVDPVADELTTDEHQTAAFEGAFNQFAEDCVTRASCAVLGDPRATVEALIAAADKSPIKSSKKGETRVATGGIVTLGVLSALYDQSQWPVLGNALVSARRGDSAGLFALADAYLERDPSTGHYSNILDANLAVNCNDSRLKITDALVAARAAQWMAKYPIFGRNAAASLYSCYSWPPSGHPLPPASAPGAPPILVIGTVHDPATPFAAAGVLAKALGSGRLLTWDGEGHTAYPKTTCIRTKVDSYLISDKIPTGTSCPPG
ncbi:MAG TPA: alpha/beta hydrolase [Jatrophihabitans sp.]|nr:alpha/beta hydrolase [Jatrophihabitans sp.]